MSLLARDGLGALCRETHAALPGSGRGPLAGLSFVAKDVFAVEGQRTGAGSPDWLRTHPPAERTAPVVRRLLEAGAELVGRAHTDELAYSLNGQNAHYGTPVNPRAPDRIPGGSSSGSAVAVAGGLADFSLGTDCGGSVRLPASYCGILGMRPSHGRIPAEEVVGLAPSFDTVGWFAREPAVLQAVGQVLLQEDAAAAERPRRLLVAADLFARVPAAVADALEAAVAAVAAVLPQVERGPLLPSAGFDGAALFRTIQGAEVWALHGDWVRRTRPDFGPGVRERFELAAAVGPDRLVPAQQERERFAAALRERLGDGLVVCLPTAPGIAPLRQAGAAELEEFRAQALGLLSVAGLARLPQVSLPLGSLEGCPLGLSLLGAPGTDATLLALAGTVMQSAGGPGPRSEGGVAGF